MSISAKLYIFREINSSQIFPIHWNQRVKDYDYPIQNWYALLAKMTKKYVSKNCANKKPDRPWTRKQSDITDIEYQGTKTKHSQKYGLTPKHIKFIVFIFKIHHNWFHVKSVDLKLASIWLTNILLRLWHFTRKFQRQQRHHLLFIFSIAWWRFLWIVSVWGIV